MNIQFQGAYKVIGSTYQNVDYVYRNYSWIPPMTIPTDWINEDSKVSIGILDGSDSAQVLNKMGKVESLEQLRKNAALYMANEHVQAKLITIDADEFAVQGRTKGIS